MAQQHKIASREAEVLRHKLRWKVSPYRESDDSEWAYRAVNKNVSRRAGITGSFTKASISEKQRWISAAEEIINESRMLK